MMKATVKCCALEKFLTDTKNEEFERRLPANEIDEGTKADVFVNVRGPTEYGLWKKKKR